MARRIVPEQIPPPDQPVQPRAQRSDENGDTEGCHPLFDVRRSGGEEPLLDLALPSGEVFGDLDGVRMAALVAQVPAVRRVEAGMGYGELEETARSEHPEDLGQHAFR